MKQASIASHLAQLSLVLLMACRGPSAKPDAGMRDGTADVVATGGTEAASLGAKVDCTTGKETGCEAETQALLGCLPTTDGSGP